MRERERERERLQENISFQYAWNNFRIISILSEELGIWFAKEGMLERGENMHKMGLKRVVFLAKICKNVCIKKFLFE